MRISYSSNKSIKIDGIFFCGKDNKPISVYRYEFSEKIFDSIKAISAQNKSLGKTLSEKKSFEEKDGNFEITPKGKLLSESIEYFVLSILSTKLIDYFNHADHDKNRIVNLTRKDIPQVLLSNRFVELFSRPLDERDDFDMQIKDQNGKIVYAVGKDGQIYDNFELTLPFGAHVTRTDDGSIRLAMKRFSIDISCHMTPYSTIVPPSFSHFYLNKNHKDLHLQKTTIDISIKFRPFWMLSQGGWQYYSWLDIFLEEIIQSVDFDLFMNRINWDLAETLKVIQHHERKNTTNRKRADTTVDVSAVERDVDD